MISRYTRDFLEKAHKASSLHRDELAKSRLAGCFYCCEIYPTTEITEWIDEDMGGRGDTAMCPKCGIDSVIGDASGYEITDEFLFQMMRCWFGEDVTGIARRHL